MAPTLSVIVPTQGRPTLQRMLDSVVGQLLPDEEVLVVIDSHGMNHQAVQAIRQRIFRYPQRVHTLAHDAGGHDFGHSQINHGIDYADGDWLTFMDDDDVYTPGALDAMREAIAQLPEPLPLLFRFRSYWGATLWLEEHRAAGVVQEGAIGGHCLVAPREGIGRRTTRYQADYDQIAATVNNYGGRVGWVDYVIAQARP